MKNIIQLAAIAATSSLTLASISDMYMVDSEGGLYSVNGTTLQATQIAQLDNALYISDIIMLDGNTIAANLNGAIGSYNLNTNEQGILFNISDVRGPNAAFSGSSGAARRNNGDLLFGAFDFPNSGPITNFSIAYNPLTQTPSRANPITDSHTPIDIYELPNGDILSITGLNRITLQSYDTTDYIQFAVPSVGIISSFVQSADELFLMNTDGELYTFDYSGNTELRGQITGFNHQAMGATIASHTAALVPSPSTLALLTPTLALATRRRR